MSHSATHTTIVASITIVRNQEGKYLFLKRSDQEAYAPQKWDFPGGAKDFLESTEEAAIRECKEESGLDVKLEKLVWHRVSQGGLDPSLEFVTFYYLASTESTDVQISNEHCDQQWLTLEEGRELDSIPWMKEFYKAIDNGVINL